MKLKHLKIVKYITNICSEKVKRIGAHSAHDVTGNSVTPTASVALKYVPFSCGCCTFIDISSVSSFASELLTI